MRQKICVVLVDRANYGRMKPVMECLRDDSRFDMTLICAGAMLLERFGKAVDVVRADGFTVHHTIYTEVEGSTPTTMVASMGLALSQFSSIFAAQHAEFVLLIGDRYQAMAAAIAAVYQNKCLIHIQGGEVSGSIDESTRHAITKLAHYHFPATDRAGRFIVQMGERAETVFPLGCPVADVIAKVADTVPASLSLKSGVGKPLDFSADYVLALFHPVTTEYQSAAKEMQNLLEALADLAKPTVMVWPNIDAGSDHSSKAIRQFREQHQDTFPLHIYKNLELEVFIPLLKSARCLIGNSSSFIRDASFFGTPVVLVGNRQTGRECSAAVTMVPPKATEIAAAARRQMEHGHYPPSTLYGNLGVSQRIVDKIATFVPYQQKTLAYPL